MFFSGRSEIRNCPIKFPRIFFLSGWSKTLSGLLLFSSFPPFSGCDDERKRANHFRINQWSFSWNRCVLKRWPTSRLFFFIEQIGPLNLLEFLLSDHFLFFFFSFLFTEFRRPFTEAFELIDLSAYVSGFFRFTELFLFRLGLDGTRGERCRSIIFLIVGRFQSNVLVFPRRPSDRPREFLHLA